MIKKKINYFKKKYIEFNLLIKEVKKILKLDCFINDNLGKSYFKNVQKPKKIIKKELLIWFLKYKELNKFYFTYGLDKKNITLKEQNNYLSYSTFRRWRNNRNGKYGNLSHGIILRDKYIFHNYLKGLNIDTPEIIYFCNSIGLKIIDGDKGISWSDVKDIEGFCKTFSGEEADGVFLLKIDKEKNIFIDNKKATVDGLKKKLGKEKWFIQLRVKQHSMINKVYSKAVNTIRLVTYIDDNGEVQIYDAILKFAMNGNTVDNWHLGGILCGIDLESGQLTSEGLATPGYGYLESEHPNSKIKFEDIIIPNINKIKEESIKLHKNLYNIQSIGWDIAIGEKGPIFIEGNDNWDFGMFQALKGSQKKRIKEILGGIE